MSWQVPEFAKEVPELMRIGKSHRCNAKVMPDKNQRRVL
jgi:hypothetical protein